jgi:hypothetical protein
MKIAFLCSFYLSYDLHCCQVLTGFKGRRRSAERLSSKPSPRNKNILKNLLNGVDLTTILQYVLVFICKK